jgi:uncharacterized membrane protein
MGPAISAAGLLWGVSGGPRRAVLTLGVVATALAMGTPLVRTAGWVAGLPTWFQWYVRPSGDNTTFTVFPWAAFVFAGAACGAVLALPRDHRTERRTLLGLTAVGLLVLLGGFYTASLPSIYRASFFWTSSPTYFAIRIGLLLLTLGALYAASPLVSSLRAFGWLERFGRNSLFVYWIHVELVYGYTTWVIHRRLPVWGTLAAYVIFCTAMYRAISLRDLVVSRWRARRTDTSTSPRPAAVQA